MGGIPYRGAKPAADKGEGEGGTAAQGKGTGRGRKAAGVALLLLLAAGYAAWRGLEETRGGTVQVVGAGRATSAAATDGADASDVPGGSATPTVETIRVQVVGAVRSPGIYEIPKGACLDVLVAAAGGFTAEADVERINLVWRIERSLMIRIGERAEPSGGAPGGVEGVSGAGEAVQVTDQASMPSGEGEGGGSGPLDLNAATAAELDALPGIGPSTAAAIVAYREKNGPFARIEDLMKVSGIKQSRFDAVKDQVCVG